MLVMLVLMKIAMMKKREIDKEGKSRWSYRQKSEVNESLFESLDLI